MWIVYVYIASAVFQQHQYEVSISHLILCCITCCFCHDCHDRGLLLKQLFLVVNVESLFLTIHGRHHDLVNHYRTYVLQWSLICLFCRNLISILFSFMTCYKSVDKSDTSSAFSWVGTAYPFDIVTDDAIVSFSLSTTSILYQQIMHQLLLHIHNNRHTLVFNFFNRCTWLAYVWTIALFEVNVLTTYAKLERICFLMKNNICYGVWYPFALINMPYRYSSNKKGKKKAEPIRYISTCRQTENIYIFYVQKF